MTRRRIGSVLAVACALFGCPHGAPTSTAGHKASGPIPVSSGATPSHGATSVPLASPGALGVSSSPGSSPLVLPSPTLPSPSPVGVLNGGNIASTYGNGIASTYGNGLVSVVDAGVVSNNGGRLIGQVKVPAGLIGQVKNASELIGQVKSDGIISDLGSGIISDQGSNLIGQTKNRRLLAAPNEVPAANALVFLLDGAGHFVVDGQNRLVATVADARGNYAFKGIQLQHNMLVAVDLGTKGVLQAIAPKPASTGDEQVDIATISTLTTSYILDQYVLPQAHPTQVLDKLPASVEADTRTKAASALATSTTALPDSLTRAAVDTTVLSLRQQNGAFDTQMETVKKLLVVGGSARQTDGNALLAQIASPRGVAADGHGNVYVADTSNHLIRRLGPDGNLVTLAGNGTAADADGDGTAAAIGTPQQLALDQHDPSRPVLYVSEPLALRAISLADPAHPLVTTVKAPVIDNTIPFPLTHSTTEVKGAPMAIATAPDGTLYATNWSAVFRLNADGTSTYLAGAFGPAASPTDPTGFSLPHGLCVDASGNVYVTDEQLRRVSKVTPAGQVSVVAGTGAQMSVDGPGATAAFFRPEGIAVDASGSLYVADTGYQYAQPGDTTTDVGDKIRKITPDGTVSTLAGAGPAGHADGQGAAASFQMATAVSALPDGTLYVADTANNLIRKIDPGGKVTTAVGSGAGSFNNANGTSALLDQPQGLAIDRSTHTIYVADQDNDAVRIVTPAGDVTTLAGMGGQSGHADGPGATATFNRPRGLCLDGHGHLYVADTGNNLIREIDLTASDHPVKTVAGSGRFGFADGAATSAQFRFPGGVAVAADGTLYVADTGNFRIRKVAPDGSVTTLAGTDTEILRDGQGASAGFRQPTDLVLGPDGNLYVADADASVLRKVTPAGTVTTFAGGSTPALPGGVETFAQGATDGTGAAARFWYPSALTVGPDGNLYVADTGNHLVRKVTLTGAVTTVSATGGTLLQFPGATGIAVDADGTLYIASPSENQVRQVKVQ